MARVSEEPWDWPPPRRFFRETIELTPTRERGGKTALKVGYGALWTAKWIAILGFGALAGVVLAILVQVFIVQAAKAAESKNGCVANYEKFVAIKTGMTLAEAVSIMGCDGIEVSTTEMAGSRTEMLKWNGKESAIAAATLTFVNGRLMSKTQLGLR